MPAQVDGKRYLFSTGGMGPLATVPKGVLVGFVHSTDARQWAEGSERLVVSSAGEGARYLLPDGDGTPLWMVSCCCCIWRPAGIGLAAAGDRKRSADDDWREAKGTHTVETPYMIAVKRCGQRKQMPGLFPCLAALGVMDRRLAA